MLATVLAACQVDSYDSGDGEYSMLTADFVEAHTSQASAVDYAVTDGGDSLVMQQPLSADWADKADTLYRAILYYDHADGTAVRARSIVQVPVLRPNLRRLLAWCAPTPSTLRACGSARRESISTSGFT